MDWSDPLAVQGTPKSLLQHHISKVLSLLYGPILNSIHDYGKNHSFWSQPSAWLPLVMLFQMDLGSNPSSAVYERRGHRQVATCF